MREHKRVLYFNLLTSGKLYEHLAEIDTSARDEELIPEMSQGKHSNLGTVFFAAGFSVMMVLDVALG